MLHPLFGEPKYHYPTALEPIVQVASQPLLLVVRGDQPWLDLEELIQYANENPGKVKFAHSGVGSMTHLVGESFSQHAKIKLQQVPFRGSSESLAALLGGHVQVAISGPGQVGEHIRSGSLRALAISSSDRLKSPSFINVPTFKEQGLDVVYNLWFGIGAPKGIPSEVKARLAKGFREIIDNSEFKSSQEKLSLQTDYLNPADSAKKWLEESEKFSLIVKETGIDKMIKAQKK